MTQDIQIPSENWESDNYVIFHPSKCSSTRGNVIIWPLWQFSNSGSGQMVICLMQAPHINGWEANQQSSCCEETAETTASLCGPTHSHSKGLCFLSFQVDWKPRCVVWSRNTSAGLMLNPFAATTSWANSTGVWPHHRLSVMWSSVSLDQSPSLCCTNRTFVHVLVLSLCSFWVM